MCKPNFSMAFWVHRACVFFVCGLDCGDCWCKGGQSNVNPFFSIVFPWFSHSFSMFFPGSHGKLRRERHLGSPGGLAAAAYRPATWRF